MHSVTVFGPSGNPIDHLKSQAAFCEKYSVDKSVASRLMSGYCSTSKLEDGTLITIRKGYITTPIDPVVRAYDPSKMYKPVVVFDRQGKIYGKYPSVTHAADDLGIIPTQISGVMHGRTNFFRARDGKPYTASLDVKKTHGRKIADALIARKTKQPITCWTSDGNVYKTYPTIRAVILDLDLSPPTIFNTLNGKQKGSILKNGLAVTFRRGIFSEPIAPFQLRARRNRKAA